MVMKIRDILFAFFVISFIVVVTMVVLVAETITELCREVAESTEYWAKSVRWGKELR